MRRSCDALHCGRRPYLHDDLDAIRLNSTLVLSPPVTLWPYVERRGQLPPDVEKLLRRSNTPFNIACTRRRWRLLKGAAGDALSLDGRQPND